MPRQPQSDTVIVATTDLIFRTKIASTAQAAGAVACFVAGADELAAALERSATDPPRLVIVDLNACGGEPVELVRAACQRACGSTVVAYVSHVDQELAARAKEAGAHEVMPRSRFSRELPQLLAAR